MAREALPLKGWVKEVGFTGRRDTVFISIFAIERLHTLSASRDVVSNGALK